jgi:hypothetical protein
LYVVRINMNDENKEPEDHHHHSHDDDYEERCGVCGKTRKQDVEARSKAIVKKVERVLELFTADLNEGLIEVEEDIEELKRHLYCISRGICRKCGSELYEESPYYEGLYEPYLDVCWHCIAVLGKGNKDVMEMLPQDWRELEKMKDEEKESREIIAARNQRCVCCGADYLPMPTEKEYEEERWEWSKKIEEQFATRRTQ